MRQAIRTKFGAMDTHQIAQELNVLEFVVANELARMRDEGRR